MRFVEDIIIKRQGALLEVKRILSNDNMLSTYRKRGIRGRVTSFSKDSRLRLIKTAARVDRTKINFLSKKPKFITLTYKENNDDYQGAKRDLKVFSQRFIRAFPKASFLWRMEHQKRGAIHFHLVIFNAPYFSFKEWNQKWCDVTDEDSPNALDGSVIDSIGGVMHYVAKYVAKLEDAVTDADALLGLSMPHKRPRYSGRWWGVVNRKHYPAGKLEVQLMSLPYDLYIYFMTKLQHDYARCWQSFSIIDGNAGTYYRKLLGMRRFRQDAIDLRCRAYRTQMNDGRSPPVLRGRCEDYYLAALLNRVRNQQKFRQTGKWSAVSSCLYGASTGLAQIAPPPYQLVR